MFFNWSYFPCIATKQVIDIKIFLKICSLLPRITCWNTAFTRPIQICSTYHCCVSNILERQKNQKRKYKCNGWKSEARVTNSDLQATSSNRRVTSSNPRVTSSNPRDRGSKAQDARLNARVGTLKARVGRLKARDRTLKARVRRLKAWVEVIKPRVR